MLHCTIWSALPGLQGQIRIVGWGRDQLAHLSASRHCQLMILVAGHAG